MSENNVVSGTVNCNYTTAAIEELRAASERLAWLEGQPSCMVVHNNAGWTVCGEPLTGIAGYGSTLAAAIDEARGKEGKS